MIETFKLILIPLGITIMLSLSNCNNENKFNYVKKTELLPIEDSFFHRSTINPKIKVLYTAKFDLQYFLSFLEYENYKLVIRKIESKEINFLNDFKVVFNTNQTDALVTYDIEEIQHFNYKIDVDRIHHLTNRITLEGKEMAVIKRNKDTLIINGKLNKFSLSDNRNYIKEHMYNIDETFYAKPISVEIMFLNKFGSAYLCVIQHQTKKRVNSYTVEKTIKEAFNF
jgi:hypothetical protein